MTTMTRDDTDPKALRALEASVGEAFDLRLEEMTEAEIEKLGEFDGW
jgi:hypothetical protein